MSIFETPFRAPSAIGSESAFKDLKGKFVSRKYVDEILSTQYAKLYIEVYRKTLLKKYDEKVGSTGADSTGALRRAIQNVQFHIERQGDTLSCYFKLDELEGNRPQRPNHPGDKSTPIKFYAPMVFHGRDSITSSGKLMRFRVHGHWVRKRSVRSFAGYPEILTVTPDEIREINALVKQAVKEAGNGVHSR